MLEAVVLHSHSIDGGRPIPVQRLDGGWTDARYAEATTLLEAILKRITALSVLVLSLTTGASAFTSHPTPVPGGANQAAGVAGTFGQKLFNGEVRLLPKEIRDANDTDALNPPSGEKWIVFTASASNGTARTLDMTQFVASIVSADGDTLQAAPDRLKPMGGVYGIPPGGQWKEQIFFSTPVNFVPVKIVLLPYDRKHQAFRITVRASDYSHS